MHSILASITSVAQSDFTPEPVVADDTFLDGPLWTTAKGLLFVLGVILGLIGIVKFIGKVGSAKIGEGAKVLLGTIFGCAFLFNPEWIFGLFNLAGKLMGGLLETVSDSTDAPTTPAPTPAG